MSPKIVAPTVLFILFTAACGGAAPPPAMPSASAAPGARSEEAPAPPPPAQAAAPSTPIASTPSSPSAPTIKAKVASKTPSIIFSGDMKMLADEDALSKTIDRIIDIAESSGGHVASRKDTSVSIKVPSSQFRETMKAIDGLGGVTSQSISADDVSEEMHDLDVRLVNLKATRARLQEFMNKAGDIPNVLTVEKELERVAVEIDKIEGRLEFLKSHAALSVINVALTAKPKPVAPIVTASAPPPPNKPRIVDLPVPWVGKVGIDPLVTLKK